MDKILGLQVPLESTLYKRALQELEKSCGQMCVDGLAEFNRKYAGENLDVACINLGSSNWSWRLANKAMWFLRWLWSNLVMQLPACSLRLVAVLTPSFCVCVCGIVWFGRRELNKPAASRLAAAIRHKPTEKQLKHS